VFRYKNNTQTWVVMNDLQIPWQDKRLVDRVVDFTVDLRPHGVVLAGDIVDCYAISDYAKNPMAEFDLKREVVESGQLMKRLRNVQEKVWLGGNHEDRLRRLSWKHAPQLVPTGALDFENVFRTKENGFVYKPYGATQELGSLTVTHGSIVSKHSGYSAKAHFEKYGASVMHGHTHRMGIYYKRDSRGIHAAYENGCLCKLTPEYAQQPNWQQGFSVVHVDESTGLFNVQQIPILPDSTFFYGNTRIGKPIKAAA
jgi:predicted phosphodiesterase